MATSKLASRLAGGSARGALRLLLPLGLLWAAAAVLFDGPATRNVAGLLAAGIALAALAVAFAPRPFRRALLAGGLLFAIVLGWWLSIPPSADRDWAPEVFRQITKDCQDMTNALSAYLGIAVGAVIGGVISLWIYYHQRKISDIQDLTLNKIRQYDERNEIVLKKMQALDVRHEEILHKILDLAQKIDSMERQRSTTSKSE